MPIIINLPTLNRWNSTTVNKTESPFGDIVDGSSVQSTSAVKVEHNLQHENLADSGNVEITVTSRFVGDAINCYIVHRQLYSCSNGSNFSRWLWLDFIMINLDLLNEKK